MGALWKRIAQIWMKRAADPFFEVKMRVNELVISEMTKALYPDLQGSQLTEAQNNVAIALLDSDLHGEINSFARSVVNEIRKLQKANST